MHLMCLGVAWGADVQVSDSCSFYGRLEMGEDDLLYLLELPMGLFRTLFCH